MSYLERIFENANEVISIPNPITLIGAFNVRGSFTVGQLDANPTSQLYLKGSLKLHAHALTGDYAYQLRTESNKATGNFFGEDLEVHQMLNRTADGVRGLSMCGRLKAGITMSGTSNLIPGHFLLDVDGTINGTGLFAALVAKVDAGGTFTALSHLASLWVDSLQEGTVNGSHELVYMTNNGASVMDQAFYIYGGNKISKLMELNTCGTMVGDKVDADIAYAHYRKVAVSVDGADGWVLVGFDS